MFTNLIEEELILGLFSVFCFLFCSLCFLFSTLQGVGVFSILFITTEIFSFSVFICVKTSRSLKKSRYHVSFIASYENYKWQ